MRLKAVGLVCLALSVCSAQAQTARFTVELGSGGQVRAPQSVGEAERRVRAFHQRVSELVQSVRLRLAAQGRADLSIPFSMPAVVQFTRAGVPLNSRPPIRSRNGDLVLSFDTSGPGSFEPTYRNLLQSVFVEARSTMNAIFGSPSVSGTVRVRNFDAEISDRQAVIGGFFVPDNGSGTAEIRFPVYQNPEAAAVNFVHTLLLAYLGPNAYAFDAFQEGLVRAATMRVVRTPGALPAGLDSDQVERVLENTYDVGEFYDVWNQRSLGSRLFIAPNLLNTTLPPGGSLGGIYLARYQMAGSAWQKALAEYPGFVAELNQRLYAQPALGGNYAGLLSAAQSSLNNLAGVSDARIEGRSFAEWASRQFVLSPLEVLGPKLFVHPVPLLADPGTSDFGVFLVQATWFETLLGGDEVLLSGTSYPVFWTPSFDRIFPSAQEDRMDIAGAYGSVVPNLPNLIGGENYRAATDIPIGDRLARVYLPAGAYSRASNTQPSTLYGTAVGFTAATGATLRVRVTAGSAVFDSIPIRNGAFGVRLTDPAFTGYASLRVEVVRTQGGSDTVLLDRRVNKGPGPLWLDLRFQDGEATRTLNLVGGLQTLGLSVEPFHLESPDLFSTNGVLAARWNPVRARYDIYPDGGLLDRGQGWFLRLPSTVGNVQFTGRTDPGTPSAIALRPGWNLVSNPLSEATPTSRIRVVRAAEFPRSWPEAVGAEVGPEFFEFVRGPNDAASGVPEGGTLVPATIFEPEKAYFVRSLAAEPVVLLFSPATTSTPNRAVAPRPHEAGAWRLRMTATGSTGFAQAEVGMSGSATEVFDPREDVESPPEVNGMRAAILPIGADQPLYRDMRRVASNARFRVVIGGLRKGATYRIDLRFLTGTLRRYTVRDGLRLLNLSGNAQFNLQARDTEHVLELEVRGGGR